MENQDYVSENQNERGNIVPETKSNKTKRWIFRIVCILLFAAGIAFLITFYDVPILHYWEIIMLGAFAAILAIVWCFFTNRTLVIKSVVLIIAAVMLAANWYIYIGYIPKYSMADMCAIVQADPKYDSTTVVPQYYERQEFPGTRFTSIYEIDGNPFYELGYVLDVIKDGKVITNVVFDSGTGKYEVLYELIQRRLKEAEYGRPRQYAG